MGNKKIQRKKKYRVIQGGFIKLPKVVLLAGGLSRNAKTLYALLLNYAREDMECYPAQKTLATNLGVSTDTIRSDLNELKSFGLIVIKRVGLNKPNVYQLIALEQVKKLNLDVGNSPDPDVGESPPQETGKSKVQDDEKAPFQEVAEPPNKVEDKEIEDSRNIYTTLTLGEKKKGEKPNLYTQLGKPLPEVSFDVEAEYLAKELNDQDSIRFYQKVINRRNQGEITDKQIQKAFLAVKQIQSVAKADGTKPLDKPGAVFNSRLKELVNAEQAKKHQIDLTSLANSKMVTNKKPDFNELRNKALKSISKASDSV